MQYLLQIYSTDAGEEFDVVAYLDGIYDKTAEKLKKNKAAAKQLPRFAGGGY